MAAIIQALNLNKAYPLGDVTVNALNDVSLEIYPGEMVAILGREGSGKSSLLHTIACQQKPDSGELYFEGTEVFQLPDLIPERTTRVVEQESRLGAVE